MTRPRELCALLSDWRGQCPSGGTWHEQKFDGYRCLWFRGIDGKPRLFTRNGMPIEGCDHIAHRLSLFEEVAGMPLFVDGELVVDGSLAATKQWVETDWRKGGEAGIFHAFDICPYPDWRAGGWATPLYRRKEWLKDLARQVEEHPLYSWEWRPGSRGRDETGPSPVQIVEDGWAADAYDVARQARLVWRAGGEGLVVKDAESPYERKRVSMWAKVKECNQHKWERAASALTRVHA